MLRGALELYPPTRTGIMVVVPDRPWEYVIAGYNSVTKVNESDYRIYYDALGPKGRFLCVALSTDGTTYTKPSLGLYKFEGSAQNNIVVRRTIIAGDLGYILPRVPAMIVRTGGH